MVAHNIAVFLNRFEMFGIVREKFTSWLDIMGERGLEISATLTGTTFYHDMYIKLNCTR